MTTVSDSKPKLLMVRLNRPESNDSVFKIVVSVPRDKRDKVDHIRYHFTPNEDKTGLEIIRFKSVNEPLLLVTKYPVGEMGAYVRADICYNDMTTDSVNTAFHVESRENKVMTIHDYMNPSRVFIDEDRRSYTIKIAEPFMPESDDVLYTFDESMRYCHQYKQDGFDDWRMPNMLEMETFEALHMLGISNMGHYEYWSSDHGLIHRKDDNGESQTIIGAYGKNFKEGISEIFDKRCENLVRPIRRIYLEVIKPYDIVFKLNPAYRAQ